MMHPVSWLQMTNTASYQELVRTFPRAEHFIVNKVVVCNICLMFNFYKFNERQSIHLWLHS